MNAPSLPARRLRTWPVVRRPALALLLVLPASCYDWRPVSLTPERRFGSRAEVRVEHGDRNRVVFRGARVVNDSLVGVQIALSSVGRSSDQGTLAAIALADVHRADVRRLSLTRTSLFVVGALAAVVVVGLAADPMDGPWTCKKSCSW